MPLGPRKRFHSDDWAATFEAAIKLPFELPAFVGRSSATPDAVRLNEGADLLQSCLAGKAEVDFDTARRLFTLICVLHIKQPTTVIDSHGADHASRSA